MQSHMYLSLISESHILTHRYTYLPECLEGQPANKLNHAHTLNSQSGIASSMRTHDRSVRLVAGIHFCESLDIPTIAFA